MELFNAGGHLTPQALQGLARGDLAETQRLEVAEHLSFCDACLAHYTQALAEGPLLEPLQPLAKPVLQAARQRAARAHAKKYATVAAAACLAAAVWGAGTLTMDAPRPQRQPDAKEPQTGISTRLNEAVEHMGGAINRFFSGLMADGPDEEETWPEGLQERDTQ